MKYHRKPVNLKALIFDGGAINRQRHRFRNYVRAYNMIYGRGYRYNCDSREWEKEK